MAALLLSSDLMVAARFQAAARLQHVEVQTAMGIEAALALAVERPFRLVVIDLATAGSDIAKLVAQLRALPCPPSNIVAFAPHVHEARLEAARQAGCDQVFSRGGFDRAVDSIAALGRV